MQKTSPFESHKTGEHESHALTMVFKKKMHSTSNDNTMALVLVSIFISLLCMGSQALALSWSAPEQIVSLPTMSPEQEKR